MTAIPPILWSYIDGLKQHNAEHIAETVSDDLIFIGHANHLNKSQFLEMLRALYTAFPDWHYEHASPIWQGDLISVCWRQSGTHTGPFVLPGIPTILPTGKRVQIPDQDFYYRVNVDRIVEIRPDPVVGSAPRGILQQIGVASPPV